VDYPFLSDPAKTVAPAYGVVDQDQPFASRWTFYIGTDGRIAQIDKSVKAGSHGDDVVCELKALGVRGS